MKFLEGLRDKKWKGALTFKKQKRTYFEQSSKKNQSINADSSDRIKRIVAVYVLTVEGGEEYAFTVIVHCSVRERIYRGFFDILYLLRNI